MISVLPCIIAENGDRDVCPLSLQEAMAMKVPVISTEIASVPELIDNGVSGILVPEKDENAIAEAIIKLLNNSEIRSQIGLEGSKKIEKEFNIKTQMNVQLSIWAGIIKKSNPR